MAKDQQGLTLAGSAEYRLKRSIALWRTITV